MNNAALARGTRFEPLSTDEWRQALEVNMTAPFRFMKAVLPTMKAQHYGRMINIPSTAGRMADPGRRPLHGLQAGLLGLTRAAAKELGPFGITVNAILSRDDLDAATRETPTRHDLTAARPGSPCAASAPPAKSPTSFCFVASEGTGYVTGASTSISMAAT